MGNANENNGNQKVNQTPDETTKRELYQRRPGVTERESTDSEKSLVTPRDFYQRQPGVTERESTDSEKSLVTPRDFYQRQPGVTERESTDSEKSLVTPRDFYQRQPGVTEREYTDSEQSRVAKRTLYPRQPVVTKRENTDSELSRVTKRVLYPGQPGVTKRENTDSEQSRVTKRVLYPSQPGVTKRENTDSEQSRVTKRVLYPSQPGVTKREGTDSEQYGVTKSVPNSRQTEMAKPKAFSKQSEATKSEVCSGQSKECFTKLAVAAIDFGTTYSGYAYSFKDDYKRDPLKINTNPWLTDDGMTEKTPTCILFDKDKKFCSFGYEAESKYAELADDNDHIGWRYFKHFKMMLMHTTHKRLNRKAKLRDDQGEEMLAIDVFAASINYLRNELLRHIQNAVKDFGPKDVYWVITVPAIWDDSAKQFMREAANMAGIQDNQLVLALEPEGAAIFCKEITVKKGGQQGTSDCLETFQPGAMFLLIDLGGGTVDITVEKVEEDGTLAELNHPSGGPWGGTLVNKAFKDILVSILGESAYETFSVKHKSDELFLYRNFETLKRKIKGTNSGKHRLRIPTDLIDCAGGLNSVRQALKQSTYKLDIELKDKNKLDITCKLLAEMFEEPKSCLIDHLQTLFTNRAMREVKTLMLVGGFSESVLIANELRHAFPDKEIIVPQEAKLAVLKGAVLYGHKPKSISSRKLAYTYGISTAVLFDRNVHPENKKIIRNGIEKCEDVFKVFFKIGQTAAPDETKVVYTFNAGHFGHSDSCATVEVYKTKDKEPRYVTDPGCLRVGAVEIPLIESNEENYLVEVTFLAGHTELEVRAKQYGTDHIISAKYNFLH